MKVHNIHSPASFVTVAVLVVVAPVVAAATVAVGASVAPGLPPPSQPPPRPRCWPLWHSTVSVVVKLPAGMPAKVTNIYTIEGQGQMQLA